VIDRVDVVTAHRFEDLLRLRAVNVLVIALRGDMRVQRNHPDIGDDNALGAVPLLQGRNQLGADLTKCAGDQDVSHIRTDRLFVISCPPAGRSTADLDLGSSRVHARHRNNHNIKYIGRLEIALLHSHVRKIDNWPNKWVASPRY